MYGTLLFFSEDGKLAFVWSDDSIQPLAMLRKEDFAGYWPHLAVGQMLRCTIEQAGPSCRVTEIEEVDGKASCLKVPTPCTCRDGYAASESSACWRVQSCA